MSNIPQSEIAQQFKDALDSYGRNALTHTSKYKKLVIEHSESIPEPVRAIMILSSEAAQKHWQAMSLEEAAIDAWLKASKDFEALGIDPMSEESITEEQKINLRDRQLGIIESFPILTKEDETM